MGLAIEHARQRDDDGPLYFGCVLVSPNADVVVATRGTGTDTRPPNHSEILAIQQAALLNGKLLTGWTLYSTHEPCPMCCGAITHSKISRVVWGSWRADFPHLFRQKRQEAWQLLTDTTHPPTIRTDCLLDDCRALFR